MAFGFLAIISLVCPVQGQGDGPTVRRAPPLLLGGGAEPAKHPVRLDPVLPRGRLRALGNLPLMKNSRCSLLRPVCVAGFAVENKEARTALSELERAYEEHVFGASLPNPGATFEEPLVWEPVKETPLEVEERRLYSRGFDRGQGHCRGGALTLEMARQCVSRASIARHAPAAAAWLRDGYSAQTSRELGDAPDTSSAMQSSISRPSVGVLTMGTGASSRPVGREAKEEVLTPVSRLRSARFFGYLERRSQGGLGEAGWLSLALAATDTPWGAPRWEAEPDLADVLRITLHGDRVEFASLFDDFAQDAVTDSRARGFSIEPDWVIEGSTLPRSVALPEAWEPTGSGYVLLNLPPELRSSVIGFRTNCEAPVSYVWSVARLNEKGDEISRFSLTFQQRGGAASGRVLPAPGQVSLRLVGTNLDGIDLAHPFDPDHGPHETHGCTASINVVPASDVAAKEAPPEQD